MVSKEIGSVKLLLTLYREEPFDLKELKKDLETYSKEQLIEYVVSDVDVSDVDSSDVDDEY